MAKIRNLITDNEVLLLPVHLFGRHAFYPYTSLKGDNLSRQHALISWDGECWLLEDTSTNGTFLNTSRIARGEKIPLKEGDNINFGSYDSWQVADIDSPKCMLVPTDIQQDIIELKQKSNLLLSGDEKYEVFSSESGEWVFKTGNTLTILKHGSKVGGEKHTWTYVDAKPDSSTLKYFAEEYRSNIVEENNICFTDDTLTLEELRQASLDISLFLYCYGMARQTSKKITGSVIKPLCKKDGGKPYGTVDINVWKAWIAGEVKYPQADKLELFSHYLLKQFPIINQWSNLTRDTPPTLPLKEFDKQQLVQAANNLRKKPQQALALWQQQNKAYGIELKCQSLPNEASQRACFSWLTNRYEPSELLLSDKY